MAVLKFSDRSNNFAINEIEFTCHLSASCQVAHVSGLGALPPHGPVVRSCPRFSPCAPSCYFPFFCNSLSLCCHWSTAFPFTCWEPCQCCYSHCNSLSSRCVRCIAISCASSHRSSSQILLSSTVQNSLVAMIFPTYHQDPFAVTYDEMCQLSFRPPCSSSTSLRHTLTQFSLMI